jgi:hypothetical protein
LSGSENRKRKLKTEQELQKSGKHFDEFFKTAQNIDSASASGSELVSESVSVEVSCAVSDTHSEFQKRKIKYNNVRLQWCQIIIFKIL